MILLNGSMLLLALIGFVLNHFFIHYYVPIDYLAFTPGILLLAIILWIWASANRIAFPKFSYFILSAIYTALCFFCLGILAVAAMLTPSSWVLNYQLLAMDHWLGFHQIKVMHWMGRHMWFAQLLEDAYAYWGWLVLIVGPVLVCAKQFPRACQYFFYSTILALLFCLIYVIWPSLSPASVLSPHIFETSTYTCIQRFHLLRAHQHYFFGSCGLIDFPSYHAAMAALMIWAFWRTRWLNVLATIFNVGVILATFLLGYHYLIDVIVALCIVVLMLIMTQQPSYRP